MIGSMIFKKFSGEKLENVTDYVKKYCDEHSESNIEIIIGTDSQNRGRYTVYSTVIVMYNPGHGGHCVFKRWKTQKEKITQVRLLKEVEESINIANDLVAAGCNRPKYIDLDINPNAKYKSNEVFQTAKGWVESMGYDVRFKTLAPLATTAADWIVKM